MTESFSFENLKAYRCSTSLVSEIYEILDSFPDKERFSLTSQLRRSIISVPSNIAEGSGRCSLREKIHFIEIAYGSLLEAYCQMDIAKNLGYIADYRFKAIKPKFFKISRLLNGLKKSFEHKLTS